MLRARVGTIVINAILGNQESAFSTFREGGGLNGSTALARMSSSAVARSSYVNRCLIAWGFSPGPACHSARLTLDHVGIDACIIREHVR